METSILHKITFSGVYTNFNSFLPTEYKKGVLHTLLHRTYNICSSYFQIHEEINNMKSVWQKKPFPLFFIDNCIHKFLNKLFIECVQNSITTQKTEIAMEYLGKISLLAKKQLTNILEVIVKILNLTSFPKHQIDSTKQLDLKTTYPNVSIHKYCINIRATFAIMSTLAKPNAI